MPRPFDMLINEGYQEALAIGQRGKESAKKLFSLDRYLEEIWFLVNEVAEGRKPEWDGKKLW
jgi:hypothetical protein